MSVSSTVFVVGKELVSLKCTFDFIQPVDATADGLKLPCSTSAVSLTIEKGPEFAGLERAAVEGLALVDGETELLVVVGATSDNKYKKGDIPPSMVGVCKIMDCKSENPVWLTCSSAKFSWGTSGILVTEEDSDKKRVLIVGGATKNLGERRIEALSLSKESGSWKYDSVGKWRSVGNLPEGRHSVHLAAVPGPIHGERVVPTHLVALGGRKGPNTSGKPFTDVIEHPITFSSSEEWSVMSPSEETRQKASILVMGNYIMMIGGGRDAGAIASFEIFDRAGNRWFRGPSLSSARENATSFFIHSEGHLGGIVTLGGYENNKRGVKTVEYWDFSSTGWQVIGSISRTLDYQGSLVNLGSANPTMQQIEALEKYLLNDSSGDTSRTKLFGERLKSLSSKEIERTPKLSTPSILKTASSSSNVSTPTDDKEENPETNVKEISAHSTNPFILFDGYNSKKQHDPAKYYYE